MHDGRRRDVLKAVAVTAASALAGFAPGVDAEDRAIRSRPLMTVRISAATRQTFGSGASRHPHLRAGLGRQLRRPTTSRPDRARGGDWLLLRVGWRSGAGSAHHPGDGRSRLIT